MCGSKTSLSGVDERLRGRELVDDGEPRELGGESRGEVFLHLVAAPFEGGGDIAQRLLRGRLALGVVGIGRTCRPASDASASRGCPRAPASRSRTCSLSTPRQRAVSSSSVLQNASFFGSVSIDSFTVKSSGLARMRAMIVGDDAAPAREQRGRLASEDEVAGAELVVHVGLEARELLHVALEQEDLSAVEIVDQALEGLLGDACRRWASRARAVGGARSRRSRGSSREHRVGSPAGRSRPAGQPARSAVTRLAGPCRPASDKRRAARRERGSDARPDSIMCPRECRCARPRTERACDRRVSGNRPGTPPLGATITISFGANVSCGNEACP